MGVLILWAKCTFLIRTIDPIVHRLNLAEHYINALMVTLQNIVVIVEI